MQEVWVCEHAGFISALLIFNQTLTSMFKLPRQTLLFISHPAEVQTHLHQISSKINPTPFCHSWKHSILLHKHASIFAGTDETVCTVRGLYFKNKTWIIKQSGQQCVLQSLSTDLSAESERKRERLVESVCDEWPWAALGVLVGCVMAGSQLLAAAQAIVICAHCCLQGRHLAAASSNLPWLHRVHSQQVCNWISHMSQSA